MEIEAKRVRYIKLGEHGTWAGDCISNDELRIGFWTDEYLDLCMAGRWEELAARYRTEKKRTKRTATRFMREVSTVFDDDGSTLWITFHGRKMYWTFVDATSTPKRATGEGIVRRTKPWRSTNIQGQTLWQVDLSGGLTKTAAYRGTSCKVDDPAYVIRKVNGQLAQETIEANRAVSELQNMVARLTRLLTPPDFELLVDLIFSVSGWRRRGIVGGTEKTVDMELELPSTGDRAFVQVKSVAEQVDFEAYVRDLKLTGHQRMFYVYHTGQIQHSSHDVTLLGPEKLSRMTIEAGLVYWLMKKVG